MTILLTGFEPFDGAETNPSWEAVRLVPELLCGHEVRRMRLPVEYARAADLLREEIARLRPGLVISVGVAGNRSAVTPELAALNYRWARIPDNAGVLHRGDPICPGGPAAYLTRLLVHDMIDAMKAENIPAQLSLSAGAYVCNDLYYALLACEEEFGHRGLFIHVPDTAAVDSASAARAIELCLEKALDMQGDQDADC